MTFIKYFRFKPKSIESDFVHIDPINYVMSCRSAIGRKGGRQIVRAGNCKINGTFHYGRLIHELMHVIGNMKFILKIQSILIFLILTSKINNYKYFRLHTRT